jgi:2-keto-3-deoxy-L-rhamnonate aldolase RhmA
MASDDIRGPADEGPGMTRIGTVISLPDIALAELAGAALDFAWIDLEHGALSLRDAQALAIALAAAIVLGCSDLSMALDAPGDLSGRALAAAVDHVAAAAARAGARFGVAAGGPCEEVAALAAGRADHVVFSADVRLYSEAIDGAMEALTTALEDARAAA